MTSYPADKGMVEIAFDAPIYESAKGLVGLMFMQVDKISMLLRDPSFTATDGRLELMIHHLISAFVTQIEEQEQLRKEMDKLIKEYTDREQGNERKGIAKNRACLELEGRVIAKLHDMLGTTKRNRVGIVWDPKECKVVDFR